jgi:hypothetical protein
MLSVLWVVCLSLWFYQHLPSVNGPGIASVYLQCIGEPNAKRRECKARADWFGEEARSEFRAVWPSVALVPIVVIWLLAYVVMRLVRWITRGLQSAA